MTRDERLKHISQGKIVLKARRCPKHDVWEIAYYNGTSYNTYTWDRFAEKGRCIAKIVDMVKEMPGAYVYEDIDTQESFDKDLLIAHLYT